MPSRPPRSSGPQRTSPKAARRRRPLALGALRGFDAAARHLSFTLAADELLLTQSSISRQIAAVERQIGRPLFIRRTRALALTAAGQQLQRAVRQALSVLDQTVDDLRGADTAQRITLTTYASFASLWLVPRLAAFQRDHPGVEIRIDAADRVVDLQAEAMDAAIRWWPDGALPPHATLLIDDVATPALSPRLLQAAPVVAPADLARWPLLDLDESVLGTRWQSWARWFEHAGAGAVEPAAGRLVFSFVDQAVQAAIRGQGVALVRSPFLQDCVAAGDLVMPFPRLRLRSGHRHVLVVNPTRMRRPAVAAFCQWLAEQFQRVPRLED
jgi:LysR family glycine cleavage system transcriptional activator